MKIKADEYRNIALMALSIPSYRALPWEVAKELKILAQDIEGEIDVAIGKQLEKLIEESRARVEELVQPFKNEQGQIPEERRDELNRFLSQDKELAEINKREVELWSTEIKYKKPEIYFPDKDYNAEFTKEKVSVTFMRRPFEVDGFDSFLDLCVMGILKKAE